MNENIVLILGPVNVSHPILTVAELFQRSRPNLDSFRHSSAFTNKLSIFNTYSFTLRSLANTPTPHLHIRIASEFDRNPIEGHNRLMNISVIFLLVVTRGLTESELRNEPSSDASLSITIEGGEFRWGEAPNVPQIAWINNSTVRGNTSDVAYVCGLDKDLQTLADPVCACGVLVKRHCDNGRQALGYRHACWVDADGRVHFGETFRKEEKADDESDAGFGQGRYNELREQGINFDDFIIQDKKIEKKKGKETKAAAQNEEVKPDSTSVKTLQPVRVSSQILTDTTPTRPANRRPHPHPHSPMLPRRSKTKKRQRRPLAVRRKREGGEGGSTYFRLIATMMPVWLLPFALLFGIVVESVTFHWKLGVCGLLTVLSMIQLMLYACVVGCSTHRSNRMIRDKLLRHVMRCPVSFFDTTPFRRVINRFGSDIAQTDMDLVAMLYDVYLLVVGFVRQIVIIAISTPSFLGIGLPVLLLFGVILVLNQPDPTVKKKNANLSLSQEMKIVELILAAADTDFPWTPLMLRQHVSEMIGHTVGNSCHISFVSRHKQDLEILEIKPKEAARLAVTEDDIRTYRTTLCTTLNRVDAQLIFNVDESNYHSYEDSHATYIIGKSLGGTRRQYPIDRNEKRFTLIATISLSGVLLRPFFLTKAPFHTLKMRREGIIDELHNEVYEDPSIWVDHLMFCEYLHEILIPHLKTIRIRNLRDKPAYLIMDNCAVHKHEAVLHLLEANNIRPIFLTPNTTHLLQPLDLGFFGVWKRMIRTARGNSSKTSQEKLVAIATDAYYKAGSPLSILHMFERGGITRLAGDGTVRFGVYMEPFEVAIRFARGEENIPPHPLHKLIDGLHPIPIDPADDSLFDDTTLAPQ
ncbi:hypothetical protein BLNAU_17989 [Blattamonas nauphoetae]|uniref:ABC transmembrane type-1 domain-containing protein n=1 Tax=Blattamonas nauphoetae TaxID=2049346 RepID=A0ABQ9X9W9_9EUKA|nr:hypothetical protein BLNAU_17989 [Blattamonas nauphoetae]